MSASLARGSRRPALSVLRRLRRSGFKAYFAGGCVRDHLMGREPSDYDVATSARPRELLRLFPKALSVGAKFGVIVVVEGKAHVEVATFRGESAYKDGRHPSRVFWSDERRDALRRDFTINGMFWDPVRDEILDCVGGKKDLALGVIRCIGSPQRRFREDKLRMVRAIRFACRFGYRLERETESAIERLAPSIRVVSAERLRDELSRILTSPGHRRAFEEMSRLGLLKVILPEIESLRGAPQGRTLHPEGDVFHHAMLAIEFLRNPSPALGWAALFHDVGKPEAFRKSADGFAHHERIGEESARNVCQRLKFSNDQAERIAYLVRNHMYLLQATSMRSATLKRLFSRPEYEELAELHRADALASGGSLTNYVFCQRSYQKFIEEGKAPRPLINGHDLIAMGLKPGPVFREILEAVREKQFDGEIKTKPSALQLARKIATTRGILTRK